MVTTRRSVFPNPTIPVARALRRERCARIAEAEILPQPQAIATGAKSTQRPKGKPVQRPKAAASVPLSSTQERQSNELQDEGDQVYTIQDEPSIIPTDPLQDHSDAASEATLRPPTPDRSANPPTPAQPHQAANNWFGSVPRVPLPLPTPSAPIFQPSESLIHFAASVPMPEAETKPFENTQAGTDAPRKNLFSIGVDNPDGISGHLELWHEAIGKAATAVMAHMNGHDASRSVYLGILDGMLVDPELRERLPPVLAQRHDIALKEQPSTLYNGGLIDKFISATKRSANVIAQIMLNSKNAKRERRARGARHRSFSSLSPDPEQHHPQSASNQGDPGARPPVWSFSNPVQAMDPLAPASAHLSGVPGMTTEPLTEANLNRAPDNSWKGKSKDHNGLGYDQRGVMRTSKGFFRPTPYPRRASADARCLAHALNDPNRNVSAKDMHDESGYSVYSGSTAHQLAEAEKMAKTMMDGVCNMLRPGSLEAECVRNAKELLQEVIRQKGPAAAASARQGFDLLHSYDLMKQVNVDMMAEALLEFMAEKPRPEPDQPAPAQILVRSFEEIAHPPVQFCKHPELGLGVVSYAKVFRPLGSTKPHEDVHLPAPAP